jgi:hypothetical protein
MWRSNRLDPLALDRDGKASPTKKNLRASPLGQVERALVLLTSLPYTNLSAFSLLVSAWLTYNGEANMWELSSKVACELSVN